jgi:hypothetical protein
VCASNVVEGSLRFIFFLFNTTRHPQHDLIMFMGFGLGAVLLKCKLETRSRECDAYTPSSPFLLFSLALSRPT